MRSHLYPDALNLVERYYCMFLQLNHQKLAVYSASRNFVLECYRFSKTLPLDERFAMASQIRRAALSVHLNIAEGASRKSEVERKRFYEIARGSMVEIDAALDVADGLHYFETYNYADLLTATITCFKLLSGML